MKNKFRYFLIISIFLTAQLHGQDLKEWGSLDNYFFYTESSRSYANTSILFANGFNNLADIQKIKIFDGSNLVTDVSLAKELVKQLERKYLIDYYIANNNTYNYIRNDWIF